MLTSPFIWFNIIVIFHLLEHIAQAVQLWAMGWNRPDCLGLLGLVFPWLMRSEGLHYAYAAFMLWGLYWFKSAAVFPYIWLWTLALHLQFWHHLEHFLLLLQASFHRNIAFFAAPVSFVQLIAQSISNQPWNGQPILPRLELHLVWNLIVFVPMVLSLFLSRVKLDNYFER